MALDLFGHLNQSQVEGLYKKYELDFLLFGYSREPYLSLAMKNEPMTFRSKRARRKAQSKK